MPRRSQLGAFVSWPAVLLSAAATRADTAAEAYRAMGIQPAEVLAGTVLAARVLPGEDKQVVAVATYLLGRRDKEGGVNVRLDVLRRAGDALTPVYSRDFGAETGGSVGDGNVSIMDLDRDGVNEIVVSYDSFADPLVTQRLGEVIVHDGAGFHAAWSGPFEYDATRAARTVPRERQDRFVREIDVPNTLRTRGITLFMTKKVIAVAGERLSEPKVVQETFPLRPADQPW
jgi:hypothetical protein